MHRQRSSSVPWKQGQDLGGSQMMTKKANKRPKIPAHVDSSQVASLLNPVRGVREEMMRRGIVPRDHQRDIRALIADQSAHNQRMKNGLLLKEQRHPLAEKKALKIPTARGSADGTGTGTGTGTENSSPKERPQSLEPPANGNGNDNEKESTGFPRSRSQVSSSSSSSPSSSSKKLASSSAANLSSRDKARARRDSKPKPMQYIHKENYGRVPLYLLKRKEELARDAERRQQEAEAAKCPPGTVRMPEAERVRALQVLEESKIRLDEEWRKLPLVLETPSQIAAKKDLDFKIEEIERAIKSEGPEQLEVVQQLPPKASFAAAAGMVTPGLASHASNLTRTMRSVRKSH
ncbi:hypothetical protein CBR_g40921 [Chara braunii]|uniref:Enkurin domain-containing protein n=1 Tax=Chara braunii TaxID=69332 RepID=A0A388K2D4_CHABU|nr:hypothetical protein CBR_g40921 [Chara braunii]|eukprot:GBG64221.1 hypothetical protein CBR_g40921 [Chara braunii]